VKTIELERGRSLNAPIHWVDFVVRNPDIQAALNSSSPLKAKKIGDKRFLLTIFKTIPVILEEVHHDLTERQGSLKEVADVRLSWPLGRTHTIASYNYFLIDENATSIELSLRIELTTVCMRWLASHYRTRIDQYMNNLCGYIENAVQVLKDHTEESLSTLDEGQKTRIAEFRRNVRHQQGLRKPNAPRVEGALRVLMSEASLLLTAEARMPDQRILSANGRCTFSLEENASLRAGMVTLAGINNRALATRGARVEIPKSVDFRQAALEYGYRFFKRVCSDQLLTVLPVIINQGPSGFLRICVEGEAEQLPWETMHDGQEFICIKTCLSRAITTIPEAATPRDWEQTGILLVGANSREDLPGVEHETKGIARLLWSAGISRHELFTGQKANRRNVLKALQSEEYGIFHFSGHAVFDKEHPYQSFLELCSGTRIFLHELGHFGRTAKHGSPLGLVFLNACQSAHVGQDSVTGRQLSMCKVLREAGVGFVIGMLWNVDDEAAVQVGAKFYSSLISRSETGPEAAIREMRLAVAMERAWADGSWLAPVIYS
jgi:hypothetical protein